MKKILLTTLILLSAQPGFAAGTKLEEKVRNQFERMFFTEQYVLDLKVSKGDSGKSEAQSAPIDEENLPGLGFTGTKFSDLLEEGPVVADPDALRFDPRNRVEALVVLDETVSETRAELAYEVLRRLASSVAPEQNIRIDIQRQKILKTQPPALRVAPLKAEDSEPLKEPEKQEDLPEANPQASQNKGDGDRAPTALEWFAKNQDLSLRILALAWSALASLLAVYILLKRIFFKDTLPKESENRSRAQNSNPVSDSPNSSQSNGSNKKATREELYSKDEATLRFIQQMSQEISNAPKKVAKLISKWVETSEENVRYAALVMKNCDISTIEAVCANMHPGEINLIFSQQLDSFDPFSEENIRVLDILKGELAVLAATPAEKEKQDPMEFTKTLSDEELSRILIDEPPAIIAKIAALVKPHRIQKLFTQLPGDVLAKVFDEMANMAPITPEAASGLELKLRYKLDVVESHLVKREDRSKIISQALAVVKDPGRQLALSIKLLNTDEKLFDEVRTEILLPADLNKFSLKLVKLITQYIDADTLGTSLSGMRLSFKQLEGQLPSAYLAVFLEKLQIEVSKDLREKAWNKVRSEVKHLLRSGLITERELALSKLSKDELKSLLQNQDTKRSAA